MLSYLALILLFFHCEGFERSVKPHVAYTTKSPPLELDSIALFATDPDLKKKIEDGAKTLALFQDPCWLEAKTSIAPAHCSNLRSEEKQRLIISMSNCHLEKTGHTSIQCSPDVPVEDCLKRLNENLVHYQAYTNFAMHVESMCFLLKRDTFQEDTQRAVNSLYVATQETAVNLQWFARSADEARAQLGHHLAKQQNELDASLGEFHQSHMEKFDKLSKAAELLDAKQDGMVTALQQKSEAIHTVLQQSLSIQQDVQSNQSSLLAQFSRANQTLARLEDQQEAALALVHTTTDNLEQLSRTQRSAFSETNKSLSSLAQQQTVIDSSIQKSLESSTQLNAEQIKLFKLLSQQNEQLESKHQDFLSILAATKQDLNELSAKQNASFENSAQQVDQIATKTTVLAQTIHSQLNESKKVQDLALQSVSSGFAAISSSQDAIHERQQQLLSSVAGTHGKLEELQRRNKDSFEAASTHLASIREQSAQAEERVQKVMAGLETRLEAGFQRILTLDHSILGELFTIKAVVFYVSCTVGIFLCTANKHTLRIRPHLFVAMAVSYYMEMQALYFTDWFLFADHLIVIACLRKLFMISMCSALALAAWRFRDYRELSYEVAMQNQNMLCVILDHLRRRAVTDNLDTSDLDSALSLMPSRDNHFLRHFKFDIVQRAAVSSGTGHVPPLETIEPESKLESPTREDPPDNQQVTEEPEEREEEPTTSTSRIEQVAEESDIVKPLPLTPPISPRCPVRTKTSGLQCKNSARKCGAHRSRKPDF